MGPSFLRRCKYTYLTLLKNSLALFLGVITLFLEFETQGLMIMSLLLPDGNKIGSFPPNEVRTYTE